MPIPRVAIERYLTREVDSKTWFKDLLPLEVEEDLSHIKPPHKFTAPMRLDQKICFLLGAAYPEILLQCDLGLGKTATSLELLSYFYNNGFIRRGVVFCPTNEVAEGWEDEIKKWGFKIPFIRLNQILSTKKWEALSKFENGIIIGTYIGLAAMVAKLQPIMKDGKPTKKRKRQISNRHLIKLLDGVDAVVYDQSTKVGNQKSLTYEVCEMFSKEAQIKYGLAGRAFGRDPFILFAQLFLLDDGKALGRSAGMFREAFWRRVVNPWGVEWTIRKRRKKDLARFIAASSIQYSADECVQLPTKIPPIIKRCTFPDENWAYYDQFQEELLKSKGNYREIKNNFLRMRQISSGFLGFVDDDTGERAQIEFELNPKLDLLMELLEEVPEDRKIIIFHEFTWSGSRICQELAKAKYKFGWLWGGTTDWTGIKNSLINDPEFRVLIANWKKGAMGLNLQFCSYTFFYESPVSPIERSECEGRTRRTGQTQKCFVYDLITRDSADEDILQFHKDGNDLYKSLVVNPSQIIKKRR